MKAYYRIILILLFITSISDLYSKDAEYLEVKPKKGDGINNILDRYALEPASEYRLLFININDLSNVSLQLNKNYKLPIRIFNFNKGNIRKTLNIPDYDSAKKIQNYNDLMYRKGIKKRKYTVDKKLWVPILLHSGGTLKNEKAQKDDDLVKLFKEKVKIESKELKGHVYYLVAGHGGPDPGALGKISGKEISEDEYGYDVTLRLAKKLYQKSAKVYMIVQDSTDGIRDGAYLPLDKDEYYLGGEEIDLSQKLRLRKRVEIINKLYKKNKKTAKSQQIIVIHLDSRTIGKRIDVFFYHNPGSKKGEALAKSIRNTFDSKYKTHQPGRGYEGIIKTRNLYMLKYSHPPAVYLELGNIRNSQDQKRFIIPDNRQALANWISIGLENLAK